MIESLPSGPSLPRFSGCRALSGALSGAIWGAVRFTNSTAASSTRPMYAWACGPSRRRTACCTAESMATAAWRCGARSMSMSMLRGAESGGNATRVSSSSHGQGRHLQSDASVEVKVASLASKSSAEVLEACSSSEESSAARALADGKSSAQCWVSIRCAALPPARPDVASASRAVRTDGIARRVASRAALESTSVSSPVSAALGFGMRPSPYSFTAKSPNIVPIVSSSNCCDGPRVSKLSAKSTHEP